MWSKSREIAHGDMVILWLTRDLLQPLVIEAGKESNSKFGNYRHSDLIGMPFGSKIGSTTGKGFIHVLRPTAELWTMALPHHIRRGSRVIEAGTGSGSFSHSVMRTIGTAGHLWSYEFHEARANKAREEFAQHGFVDQVTLTHRNVCKDGFTVEDAADALFLDLPAPWDAVENAKKAMKKDRTTRICCFSPCMEQVLRTVSALNDAGFTEITMFETLIRPQEVSPVPAPRNISEITKSLKDAEAKREEKRLQQIASGKPVTSKRKRDDGDDEEEDMVDEGVASNKRVKTEGAVTTTDDAPAPAGEIETPLELPEEKAVYSRVLPEVRGHTSYLTFASLLPQTDLPSAAVELSATAVIPSAGS